MKKPAPKPRILWVFSMEIDGHVLRPDTVANVEAACRQMKLVDYEYVLVVGGIFKRRQSAPVASLMAFKLLELLKFPSNMKWLLVEDRSTTTWENVTLGWQTIPRRGREVWDYEHHCISEKYHLKGIAVLFRELYGICIKPIPSHHSNSTLYKTRRLLGLIHYRIDGQCSWVFSQIAARFRHRHERNLPRAHSP